jgi:uncharacterized protein (DUF952 family)
MLIYKICTEKLWEETQRTGLFRGMPIDINDGYVHLSTAEQLSETARKYFAGQTGLVVLTIDSEKLGADLRWEPSSSGSRTGNFPHLYGSLNMDDVLNVEPLMVKQ